MKKIIAAVITSLGLLLSHSAFAAFGLGVSPTYSEMNVEAGKIYRQKITVANMGTGAPLSIVVGSAVWNIDENGKMELTAPTQGADDPTQWLKFSPTSFTLGPQKNVEILVDINVPLNAQKKEYRVAILSSTVLPSQDVMKKSKNVWEKVQVASLMYLTASKDLVSNTSLTIEPVKGTKNIKVNLNNDGEKHSRITGAFNFYEEDKKVYSQDFSLVLMPKQKRTMDVKLDIPDSLKGKKLRIVPVMNDTMSKDSNVSFPKEVSYEF